MDNPAPSDSSHNWKNGLAKDRKIGKLSRLENLLLHFSPSERLALYALTALLAFGAFLLVLAVERDFSVVIPAPGGSLTEGEVGPARFINPVLALSQPDQDLTSLVYSGLMRDMPDGTIVPDLAQSYTISPDGTVYTFKLRPNATFQDGTKVTSADVVFTIQTIQNPDFKSTQAADWQGVQVSAPDAETVVFTLPHAYAPFLEDTTVGILPEHLWQNVSAEEFQFDTLNTDPIGSGPYKVQSVSTDKTGAATRYVLVPFKQYALGAPSLQKITFNFYPDMQTLDTAMNNDQIDAIAGASASDIATIKRTDTTNVSVPLPRVFGVFFNQSHNQILADTSVRDALNAAVDKQALVQSALGGYGVPLNGPIPPGTLPTDPQGDIAPISTSTPAQYAAAAKAMLQNGGWNFNQNDGLWEKGKLKLTFTLSTADEPELVATANALATDWQAAGIAATVQVYPLSELDNTVIGPRDYDAVLFGEAVGLQSDFYAFWDSSQRNSPGLNLSLYTNSKADTILTQARATEDPAQRDALYQQFSAIVQKDQPAVFLYAPDFVYIIPKSLQGVQLGALSTPSDRFWNVYQWYEATQRVWTAFAPAQQ